MPGSQTKKLRRVKLNWLRLAGSEAALHLKDGIRQKIRQTNFGFKKRKLGKQIFNWLDKIRNFLYNKNIKEI